MQTPTFAKCMESSHHWTLWRALHICKIYIAICITTVYLSSLGLLHKYLHYFRVKFIYHIWHQEDIRIFINYTSIRRLFDFLCICDLSWKNINWMDLKSLWLIGQQWILVFYAFWICLDAPRPPHSPPSDGCPPIWCLLGAGSLNALECSMTSALAAQRPHTHRGQVTDRPGQGGKNKEEEGEEKMEAMRLLQLGLR